MTKRKSIRKKDILDEDLKSWNREFEIELVSALYNIKLKNMNYLRDNIENIKYIFDNYIDICKKSKDFQEVEDLIG
jgi:hypothetical protein